MSILKKMPRESELETEVTHLRSLLDMAVPVIEIEIPEGMELTTGTNRILKALETRGAVSFQVDDGPECYEIVDQLHKIAGHVGYTLNEYDFHCYCYILFDDRIEVSTR